MTYPLIVGWGVTRSHWSRREGVYDLPWLQFCCDALPWSHTAGSGEQDSASEETIWLDDRWTIPQSTGPRNTLWVVSGMIIVKIWKNLDNQKDCYYPRIWTVQLYHSVMHPEWQTVLILIWSRLLWIYTICPDLSVWKLRIIMVPFTYTVNPLYNIGVGPQWFMTSKFPL